ncbi:hypothetical protein R6Q59_003159 [Mikania micrantha]
MSHSDIEASLNGEKGKGCSPSPVASPLSHSFTVAASPTAVAASPTAVAASPTSVAVTASSRLLDGQWEQVARFDDGTDDRNTNDRSTNDRSTGFNSTMGTGCLTRPKPRCTSPSLPLHGCSMANGNRLLDWLQFDGGLTVLRRMRLSRLSRYERVLNTRQTRSTVKTECSEMFVTHEIIGCSDHETETSDWLFNRIHVREQIRKL